jgi:hypothetical protein
MGIQNNPTWCVFLAERCNDIRPYSALEPRRISSSCGDPAPFFWLENMFWVWMIHPVTSCIVILWFCGICMYLSTHTDTQIWRDMIYLRRKIGRKYVVPGSSFPTPWSRQGEMGQICFSKRGDFTSPKMEMYLSQRVLALTLNIWYHLGLGG